MNIQDIMASATVVTSVSPITDPIDYSDHCDTFARAMAWGENDASDSWHDDKTVEQFVAGIGWEDSDTAAYKAGYIIGAYNIKG